LAATPTASSYAFGPAPPTFHLHFEWKAKLSALVIDEAAVRVPAENGRNGGAFAALRIRNMQSILAQRNLFACMQIA